MRRNYYLIGLIMFTFFVISFLTNIIGPLIPEILQDFKLSLFMAGFLPFSFFFAYAVMSIPAGVMLERIGAKRVMLLAFVIAIAGAVSFAWLPNYRVAILSLFTIGLGMAILQVVLYPLLRTTGGEEHFAFNSVMAQLAFGLASFLSPLVYSRLVQDLQGEAVPSNPFSRLLHGLVPEGLEWVSMYWLFAAISVIMLLLIGLSRFPKVELTEEERSGSAETYLKLMKRPIVWLFFFGIFFYVGTEQGVNSWASQFLQQYHGVDPQTVGAQVISRYWGLMTIGTILGLVAVRLFDSRKVLIAATSAAIVCLSIALFGNADTAVFAFPIVGFFASVMFAIIIDLALNSMAEHHGTFAGILLSGIVGGAVWPLLIGAAGDQFGLRTGMLLLYISLGYVLSVGFWAKPLIRNKTIEWAKKE